MNVLDKVFVQVTGLELVYPTSPDLGEAQNALNESMRKAHERLWVPFTALAVGQRLRLPDTFIHAVVDAVHWNCTANGHQAGPIAVIHLTKE